MIDVIIPVYAGFAETRRCLESVLGNAQKTPCELVVVDDATPEPEIARYVDELARAGRITLLRNQANQGFVRSVNRGMLLHTDRDVVLLNSDTEVANDWLDRMKAAADTAADIATVTPFSNNATICSYPFEGWDGNFPGTLGLAGLDALFARTLAGRTLEIPTAVGFCMLIRRKVLVQNGFFDAERYGRGYGEENDFCMKCVKSGWRHVLAADVFVYHAGAVSFSEEKAALVKSATTALLEAHPDYTERVHTFIRADPAHPLRAAMDAARVAVGAEEARHVLEERDQERRRLVEGLWSIERLAAERKEEIGQLHYAMEHATRAIQERDRRLTEHDSVLAQCGEEIDKLRAGLANAESIVRARDQQLQRIRSNPVFRAALFVRRLLMPSRPS